MNLSPREVEVEIVKLLESTEREGMDRMIAWLRKEGFFTSPASTRFHSCFTGGLADHSLGVYCKLLAFKRKFKLDVDEQSIAVSALLHDVCKMGAYLGVARPYKWNRAQPKGHAMLSLIRIVPFIDLNELEEMIIKYHMGVYGLTEFDDKKGEYPLRGGSIMNAWYHHPIVKLMYFADELECFEAKAKDM